MYIRYKDQNYHCNCLIESETIRYTELPDDFPESIEGQIVLCDNNGFELRTDNAENYLRQTVSGGTLTLTNLPDPEPLIDPGEAPEDDATADELLNILLGVSDSE